MPLSVCANPYSEVDHLGRPCGVIPYQPERGPRGNVCRMGYVGAEIDAGETLVEGRESVASALPLRQTQFTVYRFRDEAETVPDHPVYREAVRTGHLVAADEATAKLCGVAFRDPREVIAMTKAAAIGAPLTSEPAAPATE